MEVELTLHWIEGMKERSLRFRTQKMIYKAAPSGKGLSRSLSEPRSDIAGSPKGLK